LGYNNCPRKASISDTNNRLNAIFQEEFGESQHQSVEHYRQVASDVLKELQDDQKLPKGIQSKLKGIIEYGRRLGLECLADVKVSG
jgi:hypothetical protein